MSVVTIAELKMGVLAAAEPRIRAARLRTLREAEQLSALPVDRTVASAFAALVVEMRAAGDGRLGVQDAWIAHTAGEARVHDAHLPGSAVESVRHLLARIGCTGASMDPWRFPCRSCV